MPECPDCFFFDPSNQASVDAHLTSVHRNGDIGNISDPATIINKVKSLWSCEKKAGLSLIIVTTFEDIITDDETIITADANETKYAKFNMIKDTPTEDNANPVPTLDVTTRLENGLYADLPIGKVLHKPLAEFSVPANGADLTRI